MKKSIAPQPSSNFNTGVSYRQVPINNLIASQEYQRKVLNQKNIKDIVNDFDPHRLGVLKVSYRAGKFYVYDGQHRLTALRILFSDGNYRVWCEIHDFKTDKNTAYRKEAGYFAKQDDGKTPLREIEKFNARIEEKHSEALRIRDLLMQCGIRVARKVNDTSDSCIRCVSQVQRIAKKFSDQDFIEIFSLIMDTWGGRSESLDTKIVGAVALFHEAYSGIYDRHKFQQTLNRKNARTITRIIQDGCGDYSCKGDLRYAKILLIEYNKGVREKLPYKFKG